MPGIPTRLFYLLPFDADGGHTPSGQFRWHVNPHNEDLKKVGKNIPVCWRHLGSASNETAFSLKLGLIICI
jgi:hypothetical protein